jgi:hypothetical protein
MRHSGVGWFIARPNVARAPESSSAAEQSTKAHHNGRTTIRGDRAAINARSRSRSQPSDIRASDGLSRVPMSLGGVAVAARPAHVAALFEGR